LKLFELPSNSLTRSIVPATGFRRIFKGRCGKVTESCRETREISGTWKQYSRHKFSGFFSDDFRMDPAGKHGKLSESTGKKS
jgi:hypothetical protein